MDQRARNVLFALLLLPVAACFAQLGAVSFDAGALVNAPRLPEYRYVMPDGSTSSAEWNYSFRTSASPYVRVAYNFRAGAGKVHLRLPVSLTAMAVNHTYHLRGSSYGCFSSDEYDGWVRQSTQLVSLSAGPEINYLSGKSRFAASLSLHNQYTILNITERSDLTTSNGRHFALVVSSGLSYAYHLGNVWIGPAIEAFHGSPGAIVRSLKGEPAPDYYAPRSDLFLRFAPSFRLSLDL